MLPPKLAQIIINLAVGQNKPDKNFKVLGKYNGAAALVFTNTNEPNVLYVWKGASKLYDLKNYDIEEDYEAICRVQGLSRYC